ncbi:MAG: hypothetical protein IPP59_07780 [Betaproteobacteria bacterium]|jgi:hypothetical protein|nr:hypothetical protein [Betaproteobacteria bacterium]MBK9784082.1 hypothetical protein [Candidatus Dechloromonas phosphorivorans]
MAPPLLAETINVIGRDILELRRLLERLGQGMCLGKRFDLVAELRWIPDRLNSSGHMSFLGLSLKY